MIAEGRVWTGEQGLKIGLVDELGDLDDAVAHAAELAKLAEYRSVPYPAQATPFEQILDVKKSGYLDSQLRGILGEGYNAFAFLQRLKEQDMVQARMPFDMIVK